MMNYYPVVGEANGPKCFLIMNSQPTGIISLIISIRLTTNKLVLNFILIYKIVISLAL